jgi:hypothetical protein
MVSVEERGRENWYGIVRVTGEEAGKEFYG